VRTANQSKNKQGSHWGSPKSFTDIIGNIPTFELPHSSQIPSVRQFAKLGEKINNSGSASGSILNQNVPTNSNNPFANDTQFYTSPVDNDNWRYYGDDSTNEYYENSITRTPTVTNVPATKFNVLNKLDVAPQTDGIRRLTRKELRDRKKGIFRKKNFENDHNNFDGKADV
jgi:hypothetical protein